MAKRSSRQKRFSRDDERLYIDPIRLPEVQARREAAMRAVSQVPPDQQVRRDEALQRMADIKKSYEFWQELVNKNMHKKIKQRQAAEAQRAMEGMGSSDCLHDGANEGAPPNSGDSMAADCHDFFSEQDLRFLRTRLDEIVSQNGIQLQDGEVERLLESCVVEAKMNQGFDPYGIEDEEGLHDGNSGLHEPGCNGGCEDEDEDEDNYYMDDAEEETVLYDKRTTHHHIDVELRAGKDDTSGHGDCGSACEFTFEYDRDGKLIPTSSNLEEKLRLMNLQSEVSREAISLAQAHALAMAMAITSSAGKKKKSQRKKRKGKSEDAKTNCTHEGDNACLFCRYEEFYGVKPVLHMRKQDFTHRCELERRMKIRDKLENVKLDRHTHHNCMDGECLSDGTVEDE